MESNGKEVINTRGIPIYKEMSFTKENSIIDYKVSNKITVGGITYIENVKDKLNFWCIIVGSNIMHVSSE